MKKRIFSVILICIISIEIVACGKVDEETQSVIDMIRQIGEVDYDKEEFVTEIEDAYALLTEEQQAKVSNYDDLLIARQELNVLIAARPIPFCTANWKTTQGELIELMGRSPDAEYDNEYYGHILQYDNIEYEGYNEIARFSFEKETLTRVFYCIDGYDESTYKYFIDMNIEKYGEPTMENEAGKRWDTENVLVGVNGTKLLGGSIECLFMSPELLEE